MYVYEPGGAVLCWQRIPTETSGCCVRESHWMLLGSAHAVPMYGVTAVTVRSAYACEFTVTTDALAMQCLYDGSTGCAYQHELLAPCYLLLETELI